MATESCCILDVKRRFFVLIKKFFRTCVIQKTVKNNLFIMFFSYVEGCAVDHSCISIIKKEEEEVY
jgi:hypothetical protein